MEAVQERKSGVTERLKFELIDTFASRGASKGVEEKLRELVGFVEKLHDGQKRADGQVHFDHLLRVARRVIRWRRYWNDWRVFHNLIRYDTYQDVALIFAALLHDSIEDQSERLATMFDELSESERKKIRILPRWKRFSPEQIKALQFLSHKYGEKVADLVAGVSIVKPSSKDTANRTEYIKGWHAHVAQIIKEKHRRLFIIKLADFVDNATGLETIQSDKKRLALAQKYTAVYRLFVDGIGRMSSLISKDNRRVIIRTLEEAEPVAEEIIKREDGRNRAQ